MIMVHIWHTCLYLERTTTATAATIIATTAADIATTPTATTAISSHVRHMHDFLFKLESSLCLSFGFLW